MANKWEKRYFKEAEKRVNIEHKIASLYDEYLLELEDKYKNGKHKSFEDALRLNKVAKKDMKTYKIITEFWRLAFHSTLKKDVK